MGVVMAGGRSRFRRLLGCTLALLLITPVMATEAALAVGTSASTTSVAIAPDPVVAVQPAAVTATVATQPPGTGTPTGTVQFSADNGVPIGRSQPVDAAGRATLTVAAHAGSHRIKAVYSGDASFDSSSGSAMFTVNKADTTTTIASSANPVAPGGTIDFTADVHVNAPSAAVPVGAVALTIDGVPAFGPFRPDASGRVVITLVAPRAPTTNRIGALYTGDPETNASFSEMTEVVATPDHNPASQPSVVTTP